ncbi:MAG: S24 family peptidase [Bacteroidota bacterium]
MRRPVTERQTQVYEFIRDFMRTHGTPPTLREIGDGLSIASSNAVYKLLQALETKGLIHREPGAARGIRIADPEEDPLAEKRVPHLPIVSRTASDEPSRLRLRPSGSMYVDPALLSGYDPDRCLIGRVSDDGFSENGIWRGDFVVVAELPVHRLLDDDTVAALVGESLIARRFTYGLSRYALHPAHRSYETINTRDNDLDCYLIGRVVGVVRRV